MTRVEAFPNESKLRQIWYRGTMSNAFERGPVDYLCLLSWPSSHICFMKLNPPFDVTSSCVLFKVHPRGMYPPSLINSDIVDVRAPPSYTPSSPSPYNSGFTKAHGCFAAWDRYKVALNLVPSSIYCTHSIRKTQTHSVQCTACHEADWWQSTS